MDAPKVQKYVWSDVQTLGKTILCSAIVTNFDMV